MSHDVYGDVMLAALVLFAVLASWSDARRHRVSNRLNAAIALTGLAAQAVLNGFEGVGQGLLGMGVGFAMLVVLWAMNGMGAGDVKFMAAIGAWLGPWMTFYAVLAGGLAGGVMAVAMILYHRNWSQTAGNLGLLLIKVRRRETAFSEFASAKSLKASAGLMPYAIPLSLGALIVVVSNYSGWWKVL